MHKTSQVRDAHLVQHQTYNSNAPTPFPIFRHAPDIWFHLLCNVDISFNFGNYLPTECISCTEDMFNPLKHKARLNSLQAFSSYLTGNAASSLQGPNSECCLGKQPLFIVNHIKHIRTLCGQYEEYFNLKAGGTHSYQCAFKGNRK
jgi:hypothetical protein